MTGGNAQGGNSKGGNTQGGNAHGGNTQGGNTQGGNTQGGNTQGGNTQGEQTQDGQIQGGWEDQDNNMMNGNQTDSPLFFLSEEMIQVAIGYCYGLNKTKLFDDSEMSRLQVN